MVGAVVPSAIVDSLTLPYRVYPMSIIDELLGLDPDSPDVIRAEQLALNDRALIRGLVAIRKQRNLSQADVGRLLGISQPSVAEFEAHDANPTLAKIRRYAQAVRALIVHQVAADEGQLRDPAQRSAWVAASLHHQPALRVTPGHIPSLPATAAAPTSKDYPVAAEAVPAATNRDRTAFSLAA